VRLRIGSMHNDWVCGEGRKGAGSTQETEELGMCRVGRRRRLHQLPFSIFDFFCPFDHAC